MPSASHGTLITAPRRKNIRKVPSSQPVDAPVASAAEASANRASATVHAPWCGDRVRDQRTAVAWANTVAIAVAMKARPATMGAPRVCASRRFASPSSECAGLVPPHFENAVTRSVPCKRDIRATPTPTDRVLTGRRNRPERERTEWPTLHDAGFPRRRSPACPLYYRALLEAAEHEVATISSERLAELAGVNAAKVRKDLSYLGSYGTRGVGYDVDYLLHEISRELGLTRDWPVAIVGIGNLGRALANYRGFGARGFRIVALVDADDDLVGKEVGELTIEPIAELDRDRRGPQDHDRHDRDPRARRPGRRRPAGRGRRPLDPQLRAGSADRARAASRSARSTSRSSCRSSPSTNCGARSPVRREGRMSRADRGDPYRAGGAAGQPARPRPLGRRRGRRTHRGPQDRAPARPRRERRGGRAGGRSRDPGLGRSRPVHARASVPSDRPTSTAPGSR